MDSSRNSTISVHENEITQTPLMPPVQMKARTLLMNPFTRKSLVSDIDVSTLSMEEAIAEKLRAALTRLEPAIRDFFDIDYLVSQHKVDLADQHLHKLIAEKLKVPGNLHLLIYLQHVKKNSKPRSIRNLNRYCDPPILKTLISTGHLI